MRSREKARRAVTHRASGNCVLRIWINAERVSSLTPISYPICGRMKSALAIAERACGYRFAP